MAEFFGAKTDHFGILAIVDGAGTLADVLEIVNSTSTTDAQSRANAQNENGDIVASSYYGNSDGALKSVSCVFAVKTGTLNTELIKLGQVAAGKVVESVSIATSNSAFPQVTVSGKLGAETMCADILHTFPLFDYNILGCQRAQLIGFTVGATGRLTASTLSASVSLSQQTDGLGEPVAHGVSGGELTVQATLVAVTGAPTITWTDTDLTESQEVGLNEGQAAYHTTTSTASGTLVRDVA
jgi:hypothetical protein